MRRRKLKILRAHSGFEAFRVLIRLCLYAAANICVSLTTHYVRSPSEKARHEW